MELNVEIIKELMASVAKSGVDILKLETSDFKLTLERNTAAGQQEGKYAPQVQILNADRTAVQATSKEPEKQLCGNVVASPIVGTFYAAASPDKPPFVKVGQKVKKGDVLFIVESMKLMNEVASDYDGTVAEIMAEDGQSLEYGQPVMRIE